MGRVDQTDDVLVEPEARGSLGRVIAPCAFEYAGSVVDDMRADVDAGVRPIDERAVHPDFASTKRHDRSCGQKRGGLENSSTYWDSPRKGQREVRACSGLRQCQQKREAGVSRDRIR